MGAFCTARSWEWATSSSKRSVSLQRPSTLRARDSQKACRSSRATYWCSRSQLWLGGSQRRGQRLRLLRVRAQVDDRTDRAERSRPADAATVQNEAPRHLDPVLLRVDRPKARLDVGTGAVDAQALGDALDVAVDRHCGYPKRRSKDDRCRLATDSVEPRKPIHVGWDLSTKLVKEPARHRAKPFRLEVEEAGGLDVPLEDALRRCRIVRGAAVLGEENPGDLVDALVLGLRGEDRGDEQL